MEPNDLMKDFQKVVQFKCPNCNSTHEPLIHDMDTSTCFICGCHGHPTEFEVRNEIGEIAFITKYFSPVQNLN